MSITTVRLEIPIEKNADPVQIQSEVEAKGAVVVDVVAVENHQGKGPFLFLTVQGPVPGDLVDFVKESVRKQPAPPKATYVFLRSPSGAVWRLGVDDAGVLRVEGAKADPKVKKP